jgi:hypothetical protein
MKILRKYRMEKTIICTLFVFLLFAACNKRIEQNSNNKNGINLLYNGVIYVNNEQLQNGNEILDINIKSDSTIEDICYYIFTDLNIKWDYSNLEDLFEDLKFTEGYKIKERIVKNAIQTGTGFFHIFEIECGQYKIMVSAFSNYSDYIDDPKIYRLDRIKIEVNNKNYLDLFPYNNMEDYIEDNDFGEMSEINIEENYIYYYMRYDQMIKYGDDRFGYSELLFNDGLLKSITIIRYTP